jgi:hypothetical protein
MPHDPHLAADHAQGIESPPRHHKARGKNLARWIDFAATFVETLAAK